MSQQNFSLNEDFDAKEQLYSLFYELTSEIKGKEIELDEEDYIENIKTTKLSQIISYLRDSIHILVKKQSDSNKNNKHHKQSSPLTPLALSEIELYENSLRQYEFNERQSIRRYYQIKLHKEALEAKMGEYIQLEKEFEEMKTKLKYEDGKFLENDRKDNEIFILRAENTNLKKAICELEQDNKKYVTKLNKKDDEIDNLRNSIEDLNLKIEQAEKELTYYTTTHNQLGCNGAKNAKCVFCGSTLNNNTHNTANCKGSTGAEKNQTQLKLINLKRSKQVNKLQCHLNSIGGSSTNTNLNSDFHTSKPLISVSVSATASASTSKNKTHKHNNSMNMLLEKKKKTLLSKYINQNRLLNNSNNNFNTNIKINLIPPNNNPPSQYLGINNYNLSSKREQGSTRILLCKKPISLLQSKSILNYSTSKVDI